MKQTTTAAGTTTVPASVKAGAIFSWANVARVCRLNACTNKFYAYICSVTHTYRHCKRAGQRIIEGISSSIIIRSYILDICVCDNFGLYRAAFYLSSNCHTQMKQTTTAAGTTSVPASVKAGTIFSWANVARMLNAIPMGICECKTEADAKGYIKALAVILSALVLAAIEERGAL